MMLALSFPEGSTQLVIIGIYLAMLLALGVFSSRLFRGTSEDYMLASHSIGPFLLLMSVFGTTMTAFALVGSSGEAYKEGIGVYGMMASSSGIIHSLCFFLVGVKLWSYGHQFGYRTQIQFFRHRLQNDGIGILLFPILVGLVIPYLLVGVISSGKVIKAVTIGALPEVFASTGGGIPEWLGSLIICGVVLVYVFFGGMRGTAWANTFQTLVFMVLGVITFAVISQKLGGLHAASEAVIERHPERMSRVDMSKLLFASYMLVPFSVGMFPHLFQHWLTARSANAFKLSVVAHPIFIMIVWVPCVLVGVWATSAMIDGQMVVPPSVKPNSVLAFMVGKMTNPLLGGLLTAGILAAIMSSLDSQFLCIGTMFTNDVVVHYAGENRFNDRQQVLLARGFIVLVVAVTYGLSLVITPRVFTLGVWCFSGFAGLFPLVLAAVYWKRLTAAGAAASILAMAGTWGALFVASDFAQNPNYTFLDMMPVATICAASTVALVVVSLVSRPPSQETLKRYYD
jgi:SSS family solute:Na+ symporter